MRHCCVSYLDEVDPVQVICQFLTYAFKFIVSIWRCKLHLLLTALGISSSVVCACSLHIHIDVEIYYMYGMEIHEISWNLIVPPGNFIF